MSILDHQLWPVIRPYVRIQVYDRDGGHEHARVRIELDPLPPQIHRLAVAAVMPCVACGAEVHPFRRRVTGSGHLYYACSCPLDVSVGCSRGSDASEEYERVREACGAMEPESRLGDQVALFGTTAAPSQDLRDLVERETAALDSPRPMSLEQAARAELALLRAGVRQISQRAGRTAKSMYGVLCRFAGGMGGGREVRR